MAYWGHRYHARNLKNAVVVADATSNANIIVLRDKLLDLWIQSSDWDETRGMYWIGQESFVGAGFEDPPYNLSYAAGDRFIAPLHVATLADAFYTAWLSPNVSAGRKASVRDKIIKMATWLNANGVEWSYGYSSSFIGMYGAGGSWRSYAFQDPVTFWDGVHTNSLVNIQVMAYKFTGNHDFLDATAADGLYPAKYCFNRGTKGLYGEPTARECADNVAGHFQDTVFDSSMFNRYLKFNKGELQTTYLIFENGGAPIVFS